MQNLLTTVMVIILFATNPHVGDVMMTITQNFKCPRTDFLSILTVGVNRSRDYCDEVMGMNIERCEQV